MITKLASAHSSTGVMNSLAFFLFFLEATEYQTSSIEANRQTSQNEDDPRGHEQTLVHDLDRVDGI